MRRAHFEEDTAVEAVGDGRYRGHITDRWHVLGDAAPNGGYLMAVAARAAVEESGRPDPVTVTGHFLRPPEVGGAEVEVSIVKEGRRFATIQARLLQSGVEKLRLLGAFGDLTRLDGPRRVDRSPPDLPPRDELVDANTQADDRRSFAPSILRRFDHLVVPQEMGWTIGDPLGRGSIGGYSRFAGEEPMTTLGLLVMADAYPPAVFNMGVDVGWTPTIELTVQIRKRPAEGWLNARFRTSALTDGLLEEDGEIWDSEDDLVALSRQTALVARPH